MRESTESAGAGPGPGEVLVIVPTFNECAVVGEVVAKLVSVGHAVVVVDDGSQDGSDAAALANGATVLRHPVNRGQGAALQTGFQYAGRSPYPYVATFDADDQHRVEDLERMRTALEESGADIALGSRFLGRAVDMPISRRILLKLATIFTVVTEGVRLTDVHNGIRVMRRETAAELRIRQDRMAHASEIIGELRRLGLTYVEVPVTIRYTGYSLEKGQSGRDWLSILYQLLTGGPR